MFPSIGVASRYIDPHSFYFFAFVSQKLKHFVVRRFVGGWESLGVGRKRNLSQPTISRKVSLGLRNQFTLFFLIPPFHAPSSYGPMEFRQTKNRKCHLILS